MMVESSEIIDIEDIIVDIFDTILQYDSGKITQDLALKKSLNIIEGLKSLNKSMYQEIKLDLINTIKENNT
jgi:hypothetical protein